ncbi:MAG: hypothetical protein V7739_06355 [Motiliproteus sp.]
MTKTTKELIRYAVIMVVITALLIWFSNHQITNLISALGIAALSIPTIRINEQGRTIESVKAMLEKVSSDRKKLEDAGEASNMQNDVLQGCLSELTANKGSWTPGFHIALYSGYVLLLSSSISRLFI